MEPSLKKKLSCGWVGGLRRLCGGLRRLCGPGCAGYVVGCAGYVVWVAQAMWWSQSENNATSWLHLASWNLPDSQLS